MPIAWDSAENKSQGKIAWDEEMPAFVGAVSPTEEGGMFTAPPKKPPGRDIIALRAASSNLARMIEAFSQPLGARAGESIKRTPEGKAGFLTEIYGAGNVFQGKDGVYVRDPQTGDIQLLNQEGLEAGDIAGLAGPAINLSGNVGAAVLPGGQTPLGQALGTGAGNLLRRGASALLPGAEGQTKPFGLDLPEPVATAVDVGGDVAVAYGLGKGVQKAGQLFFGYGTPSGTLAREGELARLKDTAYARGGEVLQREAGVPLRLSQKYGSAELYHREGEAAAYKPQLALDKLRESARLYTDRLKGVIREVNSANLSRAQTASRVAQTFKGELQRTQTVISKQYGNELEKATRLTGNRAAFNPTPALHRLQNEIDNLSSGVMSAERTEAVTELTKQRDVLTQALQKFGGLRVQEIDDLIQSQTSSIQGISAAAEQRIHVVMKAALDDVLNFGGPSANVNRAAQVLQQARTDYGLGREYEKELAATTIGKLFATKKGRIDYNKVLPTTDVILNRVNAMTPSEVQYALPIIEKWDRGAAQAVKADYLTRILESAKVSEAKFPGQPPEIDFKELAGKWKLDRAFFARFQDSGERNRLIRLRKVLGRLAEEDISKKGQGFTAAAEQGISALVGGNAVFITRAAVRRATPGVMAKLLLTPEGQRAVETALSRTVNPTQAIAAANFIKQQVDNTMAAESAAEQLPELPQEP